MQGVIRRRLAGEEGMSLIEVLVAMAVLALILAGFAATLISSLHSLLANESRVRANALANEILEARQAAPWEDLQVGTSEEDFDRDGVEYEAMIEIEWVDDGEAAGVEHYYQLTVTIDWSDLGVARTVTHRAYRAPPAAEIELTPGMRSARADPEIGYLRWLPGEPANGRLTHRVEFDDDGEAQPDELDTGHGVALRVITTAPVNTVEVAFLERDADDPDDLTTALLLAQDPEGTEWLLDSTQTNDWRYFNGDTTFTFEVSSDEGDFTGRKVVRFVFEEVAVLGDVEAAPDVVCLDLSGAGMHDVEVGAEFRGMTIDDTVETSGAGLDPGLEWLAEHVASTNNGSEFVFVIPEGHQYPAGEETTVTMTGIRGFDGSQGAGDAVLDLKSPGDDGYADDCL